MDPRVRLDDPEDAPPAGTAIMASHDWRKMLAIVLDHGNHAPR
ncbi:MAG TPA: hypothetical protein VJ874_00600 [Candidatus Thermoplasmatota archaeon]|nr:hypothetical protein [Candidatus Thermoplasmatota archaeon]